MPALAASGRAFVSADHDHIHKTVNRTAQRRAKGCGKVLKIHFLMLSFNKFIVIKSFLKNQRPVIFITKRRISFIGELAPFLEKIEKMRPAILITERTRHLIRPRSRESAPVHCDAQSSDALLFVFA